MPKNAKEASRQKTLQQLMDELEELIAWFERDDIELEEALTKFQASTELAVQIKNRLKLLENKIILLKQKFNE